MSAFKIVANAGVEYMANQVRTLPRPNILVGEGHGNVVKPLIDFCRHFEIGVNAERTTSANRAWWSRNSSGRNDRARPSFHSCHPFIQS